MICLQLCFVICFSGNTLEDVNGKQPSLINILNAKSCCLSIDSLQPTITVKKPKM